MENLLSCSRTLYDKDLLDKSLEIRSLKSIMSIMVNSIKQADMYELGMKCTENEQYDEAIYFFMETERHPEAITRYKLRAYSQIGICYCVKKNWDKSIEYHQKAIDLSGYEAFTFLSMARTYFFMEQYKKGIDICSIIVKNTPKKRDVYTILGGLYVLDEQLDKAIEIYEEGLKLFPGDKHLIKWITDAKKLYKDKFIFLV